jgi:hypothetical protein
MTEINDDAPGYKRPPKGNRFKPGESGNPNGRPQGARGLKTDLDAVLRKRVTIREDGELRHVSRQMALLLSLYEKAVHGDTKAAAQITALVTKLDAAGTQQTSEPPPVSDNDRAIVEAFLRRNSRAEENEDQS